MKQIYKKRIQNKSTKSLFSIVTNNSLYSNQTINCNTSGSIYFPITKRKLQSWKKKLIKMLLSSLTFQFDFAQQLLFKGPAVEWHFESLLIEAHFAKEDTPCVFHGYRKGARSTSIVPPRFFSVVPRSLRELL